MTSGGISPPLSLANGSPSRATTPAPYMPVRRTDKMRICVFCGASPGNDPAHLQMARDLARVMAAEGMELVYGGGTNGLMGEVAKTLVALSGPEAVHGIIPRPLVKYERAGEEQSRAGAEGTAAAAAAGSSTYEETPDASNGVALPLYSMFGRTSVVPDMHTRKNQMAQEVMAGGPGSGFIALTGGYGTLEELMEVVTWNQLGIHAKGIVALSVQGYWTGLLDWISNATQEGFISQGNRSIVAEAKSAEEAVYVLKNYRVSKDRFKLAWGNQ